MVIEGWMKKKKKNSPFVSVCVWLQKGRTPERAVFGTLLVALKGVFVFVFLKNKTRPVRS